MNVIMFKIVDRMLNGFIICISCNVRSTCIITCFLPALLWAYKVINLSVRHAIVSDFECQLSIRDHACFNWAAKCCSNNSHVLPIYIDP